MRKKLQVLWIALMAVTISNAQTVVGDTLVVDHVRYIITSLESEGVLATVNAGDNGNEGATSGTDFELVEGVSSGNVGDLVIPASIEVEGVTYNVTGLEFQAFASNSTITSVDLSALTITSIPQQAFYGNGALTTVVLPSTVTQIGRSSFQNCSSLTSMNTGSLTDLGQQSAMGETGLTSVDFSSVTQIGKRSFRGNNGITELDLPSITSLGDNSINSTSLETLSIGANLVSANGNSFNDLPALTTLNWDVANPSTLNPTFTSSTLANVTLRVPLENVAAYTENAYWSGLGFAAIESSTIPKAVGDTLVVDHVRYIITSLESEGVLATVNAGDNGNEGATSGTDFELVEGVSSGNVGDLVIPASIEVEGVTYNVTGLEFQAFVGNSTITSVDLSALTITSIPQQAFYGNGALTTVILPSTVTQIGRSSFQDCSSLTSMNTGNLTDLGQQSAMGETGLTSVDFSSVTQIGKRSFRGNNGITELDLPAIVSINSDNGISGANIATLSIGSGFNNGNDSFNDLPALTTLNWDVVDPTTVSPTFNATKVEGVMSNTTLLVPAANLIAYTENAYWSGLGFASIMPQETLGNDNIQSNNDVNVYPNPTSGIVYVEGQGNVELSVLDISGRTLLSVKGTQIDLSSLAQGVYILKGKTENGVFAKRVVKQ